MVGAGAAVEGCRNKMEPVADRIRPQPVRENPPRSAESEALSYVASSPQSTVLTEADADILETML